MDGASWRRLTDAPLTRENAQVVRLCQTRLRQTRTCTDRYDGDAKHDPISWTSSRCVGLMKARISRFAQFAAGAAACHIFSIVISSVVTFSIIHVSPQHETSVYLQLVLAG